MLCHVPEHRWRYRPRCGQRTTPPVLARGSRLEALARIGRADLGYGNAVLQEACSGFYAGIASAALQHERQWVFGMECNVRYQPQADWSCGRLDAVLVQQRGQGQDALLISERHSHAGARSRTAREVGVRLATALRFWLEAAGIEFNGASNRRGSRWMAKTGSIAWL